MPVTARLSQLFYERVGEQVANELVDWFNAVDATYRSDLREVNELNFARFDAKLEQRVGTLEARLEQRIGALEAKLEQRMGTLETKLEQRVTELHVKLDTKLDQAVAEHAFAQLGSQIERGDANLLATLERSLKEQVKWLYVTWAALAATIVVVWMRH